MDTSAIKADSSQHTLKNNNATSSQTTAVEKKDTSHTVERNDAFKVSLSSESRALAAAKAEESEDTSSSEKNKAAPPSNAELNKEVQIRASQDAQKPKGSQVDLLF